MRNTITLNGVESSTIPGLLIQELPAISKPLMRTEVETIDGRDGDITTDLGFSAYDKQISIGLFADYDIDQIIAYFNSKGTVIFSNEPDKFYNYEIVDQIDFERLVRYRTATVTMHCQPFKYSTTEAADILSTNSNFATLDQSINSDASNFSYSSNVQADVTATRTTTTGGGKFFATFTMNVAQGVTYYFSGNAANNCTMYGYKDRIWGTSAGFSGRKLPQFPSYTATYTGTLIIGFYSVTTEPVFIRNFKVSNQSAATVSGEGTNIVLENSAEAPFSRFDLKGNTEQTTYSGKNLCGIPDQTFTHQGVTVTIKDGEVTMNGTSTGTGTKSISPTKTTTLNGSYTTNLIYVSGTAGQGNFNLRKASDSSVIQETQTSYSNDNTSVSYSITNTDIQFGFYILSTGTVFSNYKFKIQIVAGSTADTDFEPYVGGKASPNPDYPQDIKVVTGKNVVKICGKNMLNYTNYNHSLNGLTTTMNVDGTLTTTGIPTANYARILQDYDITDQLEDGEKYTPSWTDDTRYIVVQVTAPKVNGGTDYYNSGAFTVNKSTHSSYRVCIQTTSMQTWGSGERTITAGYQLEKGSTVTDFEPYQGQSYEVNLHGNLYDKSAAVNDGDHNQNIKVTTAVDSGSLYIFDTTNKTWATVKLYDSSDTMTRTIGGTSSDKKVEFTTTSNEVKAELIFYSGQANVDVSTYDFSGIEFYKPEEAIELCKIGNYEDYFWNDNGTWKKHNAIGKYVYNNDLGQNGLNNQYVAMLTPTLNVEPSLDFDAGCFFSNMFTPTVVGVTGIKGTTSQSRIRMQMSTSFTDSYDGFRDLAAAKNLTIYYPLATPVEEEITNSDLIAQLEAISEANAYRKRTHITATAATGNVPHIIAAEVTTDPSGTITNSGNIYSKPKLTIFGSGSVGVYLNGVQMFQIALDTNDYITIDTALMEAYKDNLQTLKNRSVTGDYNNFKLPVGESEISFSGNVTMCVVENYSRWL